MSAETRAAMEAAIQTHLRDEGEGYLVSQYVLVASTMGVAKSGDTVALVTPREQPQWMTLGLMDGAAIMIKAGIYAAGVKAELDGE